MTQPVKATEEQVQQGMKLINEIKPFKVGNTWIRFGLNSIQVEEENIVHVFRVDYGSSYDPNAPFETEPDNDMDGSTFQHIPTQEEIASYEAYLASLPEDQGHPY